MINDLKLAIAMSALVFVLSVAGMGQMKGAYKQISTTDAGAGLAADFAVKTRSDATKTKIMLLEIAKAEDQEPKMMHRSFRLCLKVDTSGKWSSVQTVVSMDAYSNLKLVSWADSKCGDGFRPIENGDAGAGLAADFAVKEQSKRTKAVITPATIVKAEDQEPKLGARNFRLCLTTTVNGKPSSPQVVVTMDQYSNLKLISWIDGKCGVANDDFEQVEKNHAGIGLAADFAVKKHSETTKIKHTLVAVLKGEIKGKFATTYRVCMNVKEKDESLVVQAVVTMDQYSNMKLVSWEHSACGN
jgi:hypothetical protein